MILDSIAYYRNRKPYFDPNPSWEGFEDKWAVDFDFSYSQTTYKSVPQSKISYTIEKVEPIIVNTSYYGKKHEQGYFVTLKVPNITVGRIITPAWNQCFSPYRVNKTLEVENITLKVLVY